MASSLFSIRYPGPFTFAMHHRSRKIGALKKRGVAFLILIFQTAWELCRRRGRGRWVNKPPHLQIVSYETNTSFLGQSTVPFVSLWVNTLAGYRGSNQCGGSRKICCWSKLHIFRVGHCVLLRSERIVLLRSLKARNILLRSFFEFLATSETQKNDALFCLLFLRT